MERPNWRRKEGVKRIFSDRGLDMQEGERRAWYRLNWNDVVFCQRIETGHMKHMG